MDLMGLGFGFYGHLRELPLKLGFNIDLMVSNGVS